MTEKVKEQTPAQFIADLLCRREGKKRNIPTPPDYWRMEEWKLKYKKHILQANTFLKIYPFEVITAVLLDKKFDWVYSLYYPGLKQPLAEENGRYERKLAMKEERERVKSAKTEERVDSTGEAPTILGGTTSLRNRLD